MTLKLFHQLLRVASHLLDQAADDAHGLELQPHSGNIERIGRALIEVMEIQRQIYISQPELKPKFLAASRMENSANLLFTRFVAEALELEEQEEAEAAIAKYEKFVDISRSFAHREIARAQIRRLLSSSIPAR